MPASARNAAPGALRLNGIVLLGVLVAFGLGATSVLYRWRASHLIDNAAAARGSLPRTPEGRLDRWLDYGRVFVDQRIVQLRFSSDRPWIVTHTVGDVRGSVEQEIWGVDLSSFSTEATRREGLNAVISLPAARLLAHGAIAGDNALNVPHYAPADAIPDPNERARAIVEWAVERLAHGLERDIEGATLAVQVGGDMLGTGAIDDG